MFAPVVLPFQITAAIFGIAVIVIFMFLRRGKAIASALLGATLLFVPSCTGIMLVVDQFRYGRFEYATEAEVPDDGYIELPPTARDIVLYRDGVGHRARFTVTTDELRSWVEQMRSLRSDLNSSGNGNKSPMQAPEIFREEMHRQNSERFSNQFPDTGWTYEPGMVELRVMRSDRGGGYTVWHVPDKDVAYLRAYYW